MNRPFSQTPRESVPPSFLPSPTQTANRSHLEAVVVGAGVCVAVADAKSMLGLLFDRLAGAALALYAALDSVQHRLVGGKGADAFDAAA